jgi:ribonuclease-3
MTTDLSTLEQALDHIFTNRDNLARAVTHASKSRANYERLEFLGDRVLGLMLAEWLSELSPTAAEGELAKSLASLASRDSLAEVARAIGLGQYLKLSAGDENQRDNSTILADSCEAVIAAMYLDAGLDPARAFVRKHWQALLDHAPDTGDSKTRLQEWTQGHQLGLPAYRLAERTGPDHSPQFVVEVSVAGYPAQRGQGASKRIAERLAAEAMCRILEADR